VSGVSSDEARILRDLRRAERKCAGETEEAFCAEVSRRSLLWTLFVISSDDEGGTDGGGCEYDLDAYLKGVSRGNSPFTTYKCCYTN
jgi:hypothetical protein